MVAYKSHLPEVDCDLWCIQTSQREAFYQWDSEELNRLRPEELERASRFRFELDRRMFLAKRLMVRGILSHYAAVAPQDWLFSNGPYGRPKLSYDREQLKLDFNLSSSGEVAACVVSRAGLIGLDVEDLIGPDVSEISSAILGVEEERVFSRIQPVDRNETLLRYWTLKEAYVKARGVGLTMPVNQISFDFTKAEKIAVSFGHGLSDSPSSWNFMQYMIFDRYIVAVAKRR